MLGKIKLMTLDKFFSSFVIDEMFQLIIINIHKIMMVDHGNLFFDYSGINPFSPYDASSRSLQIKYTLIRQLL